MAQHTVVVEQAPSEEKKKRKKLPLILAGVGILALVPLVGSTFAANISLNGGGSVEFGQGTVNAVKCDSDINVKLESSVVKVSGDALVFALNKVKLDNLDVASCRGKTITVRLADYQGNLLTVVPEETVDPKFEIAIPSSGDATVAHGAVVQDSTSITVTTDPDSGTTIFYTVSSGVADVTTYSTNVAEVLLESKDS
jgi:hypothetical protein